MTIVNLMRNAAAPSNILAFEQLERRTGASYGPALARQEAQLREALAKVQALRRQHDEVMQRSREALGTLFSSREAAANCVASLTSRQRQIMDLVLAGSPTKIIAWKLGISQRTVENHRAAIMQKTGSKSLPALARCAIAAAWNGIDAPPVQLLSTVAAAGDW